MEFSIVFRGHDEPTWCITGYEGGVPYSTDISMEEMGDDFHEWSFYPEEEPGDTTLDTTKNKKKKKKVQVECEWPDGENSKSKRNYDVETIKNERKRKSRIVRAEGVNKRMKRQSKKISDWNNHPVYMVC